MFNAPAIPLPAVIGRPLDETSAIVGRIDRPQMTDRWGADGWERSRGRVPTPDDFGWYWREMMHPAELDAPVAESGPGTSKFLGLGFSDQRSLEFVPLAAHRFDDMLTQRTPAGEKRSATTYYWNPSLETNEQGEAHFRFAAPAGVRYRILIDAHSDGRVGSLEHRVDPPPQVHALPSQD